MSCLPNEEADRQGAAMLEARKALGALGLDVPEGATVTAGNPRLVAACRVGAKLDLSPDDPLAARKVAAVAAHMKTSSISSEGPNPNGLGGVTQSQFAAHLDQQGEDAGRAQGWGWYWDALADSPDGPTLALMREAGVPEAMAGAAMGYAPTPAMDALRYEYLGTATPCGAWLGRGDVAGVAAAWLCGQVRNSRFVVAPSFVMGTESAGRFGSAGASSMFAELEGPSLLVLNDLDAARLDDWRAAQLATVLNARRKRGLPTVFTATTDPATFAEATPPLKRPVIHSIGRSKAERAAHTVLC